MVYFIYNKLIEVSYLYNLEITTLADKVVIGILNDKINNYRFWHRGITQSNRIALKLKGLCWVPKNIIKHYIPIPLVKIYRISNKRCFQQFEEYVSLRMC